MDSASNYEFEYVSVIERSITNKDIQQLLAKWGLVESIKIWKFRFDEAFKFINLDQFLKSFFNSNDVRAQLSNYLPSLDVNVSQIEYEELKTTTVSMDFFDVLAENKITGKDGYIFKAMEEIIEGISCSDKLRQCLIMDEVEEYDIFSEEDRKEFLFNVFKHIALGGSLCQYEDTITEYFNVTKTIYKDLITVAKDPATSKIKILSHALKISKIDGEYMFQDEHPQSFFYLIIDPYYRAVNIFYNKWTPYW